MDNMDNFFKKQFNQFDKPFEDWERPDVEDWETIASQVPFFNKTSFWAFPNIALMALSAILVTTMVYVWILKKEITVLEKTITTQQEQIERVEQRVQIVEKQQVEQQTIENIKAENVQLRQQNQILNTVTKQQKQLGSNFSMVVDNFKKAEFSNTIFNKKEGRNISKQSESEVSITNNGNETQLKESKTDKTKNLLLATEFSEQVKVKNKIMNYDKNTENPTLMEQEIIGFKKLELLPASKFSVVPQNPTFFELNPLVLNDDSKKDKPIIKLPNVNLTDVELGYEYRIQLTEISTDVNIVELETIADRGRAEDNVIHLHGLTLDVSLHKNWFLQTGVRFSNTDLKFKQDVFSVYNTDNEVVLPDGTIVKNLNIVQETPFSKTNNSIQLLFDENDRLMDNEAFKWFSLGEQNQQTIQIPFGVSYGFSKNRLNILLGIGTQWNYMKLGKTRYEMELENRANEFRLLASDTDILSEIKDLNYFSTYATLGLKYQILNHWSIKTSATFNYHFLKNTTIEKWNRSDNSMAIGLQYQF